MKILCAVPSYLTSITAGLDVAGNAAITIVGAAVAFAVVMMVYYNICTVCGVKMSDSKQDLERRKWDKQRATRERRGEYESERRRRSSARDCFGSRKNRDL